MNVTDGSSRSTRPTTTQVSKPTQQAQKTSQSTQQTAKKDTVTISEEAKIKAAAIKNKEEAASIAKEKERAAAKAREAAQAREQAAQAQKEKERAAAIKNKEEAAAIAKEKTQTQTTAKTDNSMSGGKLKLPGCEADNVTEIKEEKMQAGGKVSCTGPSAGFTVNEKGKISGGGKITIGEAEIHAKGAVDGKFTPSISLGAEATFHKYEANVDVKIPFTDKSISLNGSLGVGSIGAHYEAGIRKYQSYMALGVGLGVGIELKDNK